MFIIATTNQYVTKNRVIDLAIKSRVGLHLKFKIPSAESMREVMLQLCEKKGISLGVVESIILRQICTKRPTYRDINNVINRA